MRITRSGTHHTNVSTITLSDYLHVVEEYMIMVLTFKAKYGLGPAYKYDRST